MHEFSSLLYGRPSPALWAAPDAPASFSATDQEHFAKCERHDLKVTMVTPHTREDYKPCGNVKNPSPIGWMFLNENPTDKGGTWLPQGTVCPPGHSTEDVCGEFKAEQVCPTSPPPSGGAYLILWLYPKAFASDTVPKTLADREELSTYMALLRRVEGDFEGSMQVRFDVEESDDEFEPVTAPEQLPEIPHMHHPSSAIGKGRMCLVGFRMVAGDRVLQAIAFNAAVATDHMLAFSPTEPPISHCKWTSEPLEAQVIAETITNHETGVPGLVVLRVDAPAEELCLECECLADTAGVSVVMISPYGYPTLESTVEVTGDLSISGIGPHIDDALQVLYAWTESFGMSSRCYDDTRDRSFWATCRDISQEIYLNSYTRSCFAATRDLGSEMEDEELIPDEEMAELLKEQDNGASVFTPEDREQLILEQMSFPGTPASEEERRAAWRSLPQRTRVAIRRLHRAFGHLPGQVLEQVLRQSKASKKFILAARLHRCKACMDTAPIPRHHCQVNQCFRRNLTIRLVWIDLR